MFFDRAIANANQIVSVGCKGVFVGSDDMPRRSVRADYDDGSAVPVLQTALPVVRPAVHELRIAMARHGIPGIHSSARATQERLARLIGEVHAVAREIFQAVPRAAAIFSRRNET